MLTLHPFIWKTRIDSISSFLFFPRTDKVSKPFRSCILFTKLTIVQFWSIRLAIIDFNVTFLLTDVGNTKEGKQWIFFVGPATEDAMGQIPDSLYDKGQANNIQVMAELRDPDR